MFGTKTGFPENNEVKIWLWNNTNNEMQEILTLKNINFNYKFFYIFV